MQNIITEKSFKGYQWLMEQVSQRQVEKLKQTYKISHWIACYITAQYGEKAPMTDIFNPKLRNVMPDPSSLLDMDKALQRVYDAIENKEKIAWVVDYDVDGITCGAITTKYHQYIGIPVRIHIPDRHEEGYGLTRKAVDILESEGYSLCVMADNGTTAIDAIAYAKSKGITCIILDHHKQGEALPAAYAIVNPNRWDDTSQQGDLAAVGVVFLFWVLMNKKRREAGKTEAPLLEYLPLVAMGTVCDMVPLRGVNRAFVKQGIKEFQATKDIALKTLCNVLQVEVPTAENIAFVIGPSINAASRLDHGHKAWKALTATTDDKARGYSEQLKVFNKRRQEIEQENWHAMNTIVEEQYISYQKDSQCILVGSKENNKGVVGIVAGRLKERWHKVACVYSIDDKAVATASGRSIETIDLGEIIIKAVQTGLCTKGGGHAMAVGFTFPMENKEKLENFIQIAIEKQQKRKQEEIHRHSQQSNPKQHIIAPITIAGLQTTLLEEIQTLEPFGIGFPEPQWILMDAHTTFSQWVGVSKQHLHVTLKDGTAKGLKAFCYRAKGTALGEALMEGAMLNLLIRAKIDTYMGKKSVKVQIIDGMPTQKE